MKLYLTFIVLLCLLMAPDKSTARTDEKTIFLLLDNSGSMKKNDPQFMMKKTVDTFIRSQNEQTSIGIISFDTGAESLLQPIRLNSPENIEKCVQSLGKIDYKGAFTNITAAMEIAVYQLKNDIPDSTFKAIVLVTDGYIDTGDKNLDIQKRSLLIDAQAKAARDAGIKIFGVAFTDNADFELMQTISTYTDGSYFRAFNPEELSGIFIEIDKKITEIKENTNEPTDLPPTIVLPENKPGKALYLLIPIVLVLSVSVYLLAVRIKRGKKNTTRGQLIPRAYLVDKNNHFNAKEFLIEQEVISIGRAKENDVHLKKEDKTVTGFNHAQVFFRNNKFYLKDNSTNFTRLNNVKLEKDKDYELNDGDEILIVKYPLIFKLDDRSNSTELIDTSGTVIIQGDENIYADQAEKPESTEEAPPLIDSDKDSNLNFISEPESGSDSGLQSDYKNENNQDSVNESVVSSEKPDELTGETEDEPPMDEIIMAGQGHDNDLIKSKELIPEEDNGSQSLTPGDSEPAEVTGDEAPDAGGTEPHPENEIVVIKDSNKDIHPEANADSNPGIIGEENIEPVIGGDQDLQVNSSIKITSEIAAEPDINPEPEQPENSKEEEILADELISPPQSDAEVMKESTVKNSKSDISSTVFQIPCKNHPDRQAQQICDGCLKPFCMDCLEKKDTDFLCKDCLTK